MKRLKLNVDELQVESFAATPRARSMPGTVHGHAMATAGCTPGWVGCVNYETVGETCELCVGTQETHCDHTCVDYTCAAHDDCLHISCQGYHTCGMWSCDGLCP